MKVLKGEALQEQIDNLCIEKGDSITTTNVVLALEAIVWQAELADVKACAPFQKGKQTKQAARGPPKSEAERNREAVAERAALAVQRGDANSSHHAGDETGAVNEPRLMELADMEDEARKETGGTVLTIPGIEQIVDERQIRDVYMAMTNEVRSLATKVCAEYSSDKIGDLEKILTDALAECF